MFSLLETCVTDNLQKWYRRDTDILWNKMAGFQNAEDAQIFALDDKNFRSLEYYDRNLSFFCNNEIVTYDSLISKSGP